MRALKSVMRWKLRLVSASSILTILPCVVLLILEGQYHRGTWLTGGFSLLAYLLLFGAKVVTSIALSVSERSIAVGMWFCADVAVVLSAVWILFVYLRNFFFVGAN